ncbi:hypothetical protein F4819DRAFT_441560 [Hypoxylon fuscum]|nr:hypothetical protein F4819DRAFT_441560 [Hypoxylon fuscum]
MPRDRQAKGCPEPVYHNNVNIGNKQQEQGPQATLFKDRTTQKGNLHIVVGEYGLANEMQHELAFLTGVNFLTHLKTLDRRPSSGLQTLVNTSVMTTDRPLFTLSDGTTYFTRLQPYQSGGATEGAPLQRAPPAVSRELRGHDNDDEYMGIDRDPMLVDYRGLVVQMEHRASDGHFRDTLPPRYVLPLGEITISKPQFRGGPRDVIPRY